MYFHTILNSLLHLLEHILYSYNHECISSTLLSTNAFWLIYPVFTALHMNATCMVWQAHAMWPEAGTKLLGHKLKTSRSQNFTAVFSFTLSPGSLWEPGAEGGIRADNQWCPNHIPAALLSMQNLDHSWQCHPFSSFWHSAPLVGWSGDMSMGDHIFHSVTTSELEGIE